MRNQLVHTVRYVKWHELPKAMQEVARDVAQLFEESGDLERLEEYFLSPDCVKVFATYDAAESVEELERNKRAKELVAFLKKHDVTLAVDSSGPKQNPTPPYAYTG